MKKLAFLLAIVMCCMLLCACGAQTPYIGQNGHWWVGETDTGVAAAGEKGDTGPKGDTGATGEKGETGAKGDTGASGEAGKSAYRSYCETYGYTGTEEEWMAEVHERLSKYTSEEIYALADRATLALECYDPYEEQFATGSGFFISADGVIATAYHVIDGAHSIRARMSDGTTYQVSQVVGFDMDRDIALLKISVTRAVDYLPLETGEITPGETAYSFGSPLGFLDGSFSSGVVAAALREEAIDLYGEEVYRQVQFTAPISQGNSGGPLLNAHGRVIGIVTSTYLYGEDLNLATFIDELKHIDRTYARSVPLFFKDTQFYQVKMLDDLYQESEGNNTASVANDVQSGYTVYGECLLNNADVFRITVSGSENVRITVACITEGALSTKPVLKNASGVSATITWSELSTEDGVLYYFHAALAPGTYTLWMQGNSTSTTTPYVLYTYWRSASEVNAFEYEIGDLDFLPN